MNTQRIHYSQLKPAERELVSHTVKQTRWQVSEHAARSMRHDNIRAAEVVRCLARGRVVELNNGQGEDVRILLRHDGEQWGVCVVLSVPECSIVTAWVNSVSDVHHTLDGAAYRWRPNVAEILAAKQGSVNRV